MNYHFSARDLETNQVRNFSLYDLIFNKDESLRELLDEEMEYKIKNFPPLYLSNSSTQTKDI